ncbi:MAG: hypothetical protein QM831_18085 [Kofleriaceae bacterium]
MIVLDVREVRARHELLEHRFVELGEPVLPEIRNSVGNQLEPHAEHAELADEALLRQIAACAQVDHRANVELRAGHDGHRDLVFDHELALIDGERPCGALRDEASPQFLCLIAGEARGLGDHVDLVAMRCRGDSARDVGDLCRRDQSTGQREPNRCIARERRRRPDDRALRKRNSIGCTLRCDRQLPREAALRQCAERLAPRPVRNISAREDRHLPPPPLSRHECDRGDREHDEDNTYSCGIAFGVAPPGRDFCRGSNRTHEPRGWSGTAVESTSGRLVQSDFS